MPFPPLPPFALTKTLLFSLIKVAVPVEPVEEISGFFQSSAFQNYLLFNELKVEVQGDLATYYKGYGDFLANNSMSYDKNDDFKDWYTSNTIWTRPEYK